MKTLKKLGLLILGVVLCANIGIISANSAGVYNVAFATSASARLSNGATVTYTATLPSVPATDDGLIYLYALQPYEYAVSPADPVVASAPVSQTPVFSFPLNGMICNKFALAIKSGGAITMIANGQYITNPEAAATQTRAPQSVGFVEPYEKMSLFRIGESSVDLYKLGNYSTTVIVNKADPDLIHPAAKIAETHRMTNAKQYYMLNAANATGVAKLSALMKNLAGGTNIDEFIVGNEVNARCWNYVSYMNWDQYIREYAQAFRVAYNSIKSTNANATVFISLDQCWDRNRSQDQYDYIDAADFLIKFNQIICSEGNIDWGLAAHPYLTPLTYAKFWDMSGCPSGSYYAQQITGNKMLSFQNLPIMTSFMMLPAMHSPKGGVRTIILPEVGITQAQGVDVQAAAMVACYTACRNNPAIKRMYFHRMNEGGALNFSTVGQSEAVYQALLAGNPGQYDAWAKSYIGIADWHQILSY